MHSTARNNPSFQPAEICGYSVLRALTAEQSYLARGPGGRRVVLKRLDDDCLLGNQLHPSIKERLARVRELAHGGVANLHGVAREGDAAWLIWEYVEGQIFDEYSAAIRRTPLELLNLARELILAVDALHTRGIVHGALIGTNVIVMPEGTIRLIHISPLLYTDMALDVDCVVSLLQEAVARRGEQELPLGRLLAEAAQGRPSLRDLATRIAALLEIRSDGGPPEVREQERHIRRRTLVAAGVVGILGLVLAYGIWRVTEGNVELHPAHWLMPSSTPGK